MSLARPSKEHLEWADCEIGVIIHHDFEVYDETYEHLEPDKLPEAAYSRYRLKLHGVLAEPHLREFAAYHVAP